MKSPLEIIAYFFPAVTVAADPSFDPEAERVEPEVKVKVGVDRDEENDSYQVALDISFEPESEENNYPYSVSLIAIGIFKVDPNFPDPEKLLALTGASISFLKPEDSQKKKTQK